MTPSDPVLEPWVEAARARAQSLSSVSPAWLGEARDRAVEAFAAAGFPTRRDEEWRYTNVRSIVDGPFRTALPEATAAVDMAPYTVPALDGPRIVFVDGLYREDLSDLSSLAKGIELLPMSRALGEAGAGPDTIGGTPDGAHPFHALNTACFADGVSLRAAAGAVQERPIHVLCIGGVGGTGASHLRHRYEIEGGARVFLVEEYRGDAPTFTNVVTEVRVGSEARLDRVKISQEGRETQHVSYLDVRQEGHSTFHDLFFGTGAALTRNEIEVLLDGEECESTINGLYHLDGERQVDNHTLLRHAKAHCRSWELYRGVLDDHSRGIFTGKIHVYEDAQKTDAKQNSNSLLLSRDAEADTRPRLEIHADDVRCTHGATVGELDETALFYLRARGIDADAARRMLVHAFAGEVLDSIEDEALRAELVRRLGVSLEG